MSGNKTIIGIDYSDSTNATYEAIVAEQAKKSFGIEIEDANDADIFISALAKLVTKAVKESPTNIKYIKLAMDGAEFLWDVGTNQFVYTNGVVIEGKDNDWHSWTNSISKGVVAFGVSAITGVLTESLGPAISFCVSAWTGNIVAEWWQDSVSHYLWGPGLYKFYRESIKDENFLGVLSEGNFVNTVLNHWDSNSTNINVENIISTTNEKGQFIFQANDLRAIFYKAGGNADTDFEITFASTPTYKQFIELLKQFDKDFLPTISGKKLAYNLLHDFYRSGVTKQDDILKLFKSGDKAVQYVVFKFIPYIFDNDLSDFQEKVITDYSDKQIEDRLTLLFRLIEGDDQGQYYYDQATNKGIGQTNADAPGNYSRVVFVDTNYDYSPVYGKTYSQLTFYGNDKNNHITAESRADNYVEGGLGSDTIITGMGNDTIYTNANIDTKYDNEDNNTINTVIAGQGSDTIYGSKGKDIVYGDDQENEGNNWSFTDDDDIIKTYGGDDRVYGGNDSDIIEGGSGNDTLYGGDDDDEIYAYYKQNSTDKEGTDENTINVLYGEDEDDTLDSGLGSDLLYSSSCNDIIYATGTIYNKTLQIYQNYK